MDILVDVRWIRYVLLVLLLEDWFRAAVHGIENRTLSDEQKLLQKLMRGYDKSVRPVYNASTPVVVRLGITLTQIFDVDERNQVLVLNVWLDQEWVDEKLRWNPDDFGGLEVLRVPCAFIWLPDIVLYNSVDDYGKGYMQALAMVHHSGNVFWPPIVRLKSSCKLDITYFPFDDQICTLKMGSWAYDGFQVDVTNRSDDIDLTNYVDNGEWFLMNTQVKRNVVNYPCCPEPFPDVTFGLHLRRRTLYYTFNVIIPCVILSSLTLVGFMLPPDSGEKVTLGLTVLLAFSVFMLLIAENMPPTSEFAPLIGVYLTCVMAMTSLSVIIAVIILNIHHKGVGDKRPPYWLRRLVLSKLSHLVCLHRKEYTKISKSPNSEEKGLSHNHAQLQSFKSAFSDSPMETTRLSTRIHHVNESDNVGQGIGNSVGSSFRSRNPTDEEIVKHLRVLIDKQEKADHEVNVIREWQDIATVLDRCLFWVFFFVTTVATIGVLVLRPLTKNAVLEL
ncbi:neuronal acetylcholine receptor subunit alpha-10-like isoform X2 [Lineus longissimus]|uniref:neuronal acetylcholine receptor subunit alpha-10-like isoform X2 n=1 Tax=Lineus longissimus TaxID=88925 RepID=UPI002B4F2D91